MQNKYSDEICVLPRYYVASSGNPLLTSWPLKMGLIHCPETLVKNYHLMLHYNPEKCRPINIMAEASSHRNTPILSIILDIDIYTHQCKHTNTSRVKNLQSLNIYIFYSTVYNTLLEVCSYCYQTLLLPDIPLQSAVFDYHSWSNVITWQCSDPVGIFLKCFFLGGEGGRARMVESVSRQ
jgi:hypothetical protein